MVAQLRVTWTGPSSPVYSIHHFTPGVGTDQQKANALAAFWGAMDDNINAAFSWSVDPEVRHINPANGQLTSIVAVTGASATAGSAGQYIDVIQGLIVWNTGVVVDGRVLKGRTFVPGIDESRNAATGRPEATFKSACDTAAAALIADANTELCVWHRPKWDYDTDPPTLEREGSTEPVTGGALKNSWSYLKGRRL